MKLAVFHIHYTHTHTHTHTRSRCLSCVCACACVCAHVRVRVCVCLYAATWAPQKKKIGPLQPAALEAHLAIGVVLAVEVGAGGREAEGVPKVERAEDACGQHDGVVACLVRRNVVHGSWGTWYSHPSPIYFP